MSSGHTGDVHVRKSDIEEHVRGLTRQVDGLESIQASIDAMSRAVVRTFTTVVEPGLAAAGGKYGDALAVVCDRQRGGINAMQRAMSNVRTVWANLDAVDEGVLRSIRNIQGRVDGLDQRLTKVEAGLGGG